MTRPDDARLIRGWALALADVALASRDRLEERCDALVRERARAEEACSEAERWAVMAARALAGDADPIAVAEAAKAIRQLMAAKTRAANDEAA